MRTTRRRDYSAEVERVKIAGGWKTVFVDNVRDLSTGALVPDGEDRDFIVEFFTTMPYPPGKGPASGT